MTVSTFWATCTSCGVPTGFTTLGTPTNAHADDANWATVTLATKNGDYGNYYSSLQQSGSAISTVIPSGATINSVTVTAYVRDIDSDPQCVHAVQQFDNTTAIGTESTTSGDVVGATGYSLTNSDTPTLAQLRSTTYQIRARFRRTDNTSTHVIGLQYVKVVVDWSPPAVLGDATLTATATLTSAGVRTAAGSSTLTATATLTSAGERTVLGAATLAATGTLTAAPAGTAVLGDATLTATGTLTSSGDIRNVWIERKDGVAGNYEKVYQGAYIPLVWADLGPFTEGHTYYFRVKYWDGPDEWSEWSNEDSITFAGAQEVFGSATLAATASLSSAGVRTISGSATLAATASLAASGGGSSYGSATLAATATLTSAGVRVVSGAATLSASASLNSAAAHTAFAVATLVATGSELAVGSRTRFGVASLSATGTLTSAAAHVAFGAASLTATATAEAAGGVRVVTGEAMLAATATLTSAGVRVVVGDVTLTATGSLTSAGDRTAVGTASLVATASLSSEATHVAFGTATLVATGSAVAVGSAAVYAVAVLGAEGTLTAVGEVVAFTLFPEGIPSEETFGTPILTALWLYPESVTSEESFGSPMLWGGYITGEDFYGPVKLREFSYGQVVLRELRGPVILVYIQRGSWVDGKHT